MVETPQLNEAIAGIVTSADVIDNIRDKKKATGSVRLGDLLSAVMTASAPVLAGAEDSEDIGPEIAAVRQDRASMEALGARVFGAIYDIDADLQDPNR